MPNYFFPGVFIQPITISRRPVKAAATSTAAMVGLTERGPTEPRLVQSWDEYRDYFGDGYNAADSFLPPAVKGFFDNGGQRLHVVRINRSDATTAVAEYPTANPGQRLLLSAIGPGGWGSRVYLRISDASRVDASGQALGIRITLLYFQDPPASFVDPLAAANATNPNRVEPDLIEDFDNLGLDPTRADDVLTQLGKSRLVRARWSSAATPPSRPGNSPFAQLSSLAGSDGIAPLTALDYQGHVSRNTGLGACAGIDEIALLLVPDEVHPGIDAVNQGEIRNAVTLQCERLRNRFAILQLAGHQAAAEVEAPGLDSAYAAVYYPWIRVFDQQSSGTLLIPPGGHIAGIYARCDRERGVHKAPANMVLRGIVDPPMTASLKPLEFALDSQQQRPLNAQSINVIRDFRDRGRGVRVWGARTLASDPRWRYISVRRLCILIEVSVHKHLEWVTFAVNDATTRARVQQEVSAFLNTLFVSGALQGSKASAAYFVRCYAQPQTTNIVCDIGIAATRPAEFEMIRIQQASAS